MPGSVRRLAARCTQVPWATVRPATRTEAHKQVVQAQHEGRKGRIHSAVMLLTDIPTR